MNNLSIVYIGSKPEKKDTVAGTGRVFTRLEPMLVPYESALTMLRHPKVWIEEDDLTDELIAESNALFEKKESLNKEKEHALVDINLSELTDGNGEKSLTEELESITTKKALDEWMLENDLDLTFEDKDTMTYRRDAIVQEFLRSDGVI